MNVQIITDKMPAGGLGISGDDGLHMGQKIVFLPRRATERGQQLSGDHIPTENESTGAMALVLKLASLHMAWRERQTGMFAFERLDPGQFIRTHRALALFGQSRRVVVHLADRSDRSLSLRIIRRSQPVADQMRLEIPFFKRRDAWRGEICATMPRAITSSAISRPVQWLIGRSLGCAQASAIIWQVCSAVICAGRPERGVSWSRSLTERSSKETACKPIHRILQQRTVSAFTPNALPMCGVVLALGSRQNHAPSLSDLLGGAVPTYQFFQRSLLSRIQCQHCWFGTTHLLCSFNSHELRNEM